MRLRLRSLPSSSCSSPLINPSASTCSHQARFPLFSLPTVQSSNCSQSYRPFKLPRAIASRTVSHPANKADEDSRPSQHRTITSSSSMSAPDKYSIAFESNSKWRRNLADADPELFARLGKGQAPEILWIGCADSRCPETTILGLQPGDIFCHRNIANILVPTDLNSLSVIQYAVQYLKVKHIIVCGHTSCGGVAAALDNQALGLIDTWLMPLRSLRHKNAELLQSLPEKERGLKLVDLNVRNSVGTLLENPTVIDAIIERDLKVHGCVYNVGTGELNELDIDEDEEIVQARRSAFKTKK